MGAVGGQLVQGQYGLSTVNLLTLNLLVANTEYSYTFPIGTKQIFIQNAGEAVVSYGYVAAGVTLPLYPRQARILEGLLLSSTLTIYFKSPKANQDVKIEYWS